MRTCARIVGHTPAASAAASPKYRLLCSSSRIMSHFHDRELQIHAQIAAFSAEGRLRHLRLPQLLDAADRDAVSRLAPSMGLLVMTSSAKSDRNQGRSFLSLVKPVDWSDTDGRMHLLAASTLMGIPTLSQHLSHPILNRKAARGCEQSRAYLGARQLSLLVHTLSELSDW